MQTPALNPIYVDLDTLLDTRLGLLRQHLGVTDIPESYWTRETDDYSEFTEGALDRHQFYQLWLNRSHVTLEHSYITNVVYHILKCMQAQASDAVIFEDDRGPSLVINIWPYDLATLEREELCKGMEQHFLALKAKVTCIRTDPKELTPQYVKEHFSMITSYTGVDWLGQHHKALTTKGSAASGPMFGFPITVPRLYQQSAKSLTAKEKQRMHTEMRLLMLEFIQLDYIDAYWFSEVKPAPAPIESEEDGDLIAPRGTTKSFKL